MQDDPTEEMHNNQVKGNNSKRKRSLAKERKRRFREKKRLNVLKSVHHVVSYFSLLPCDLKHTPFFYEDICGYTESDWQMAVRRDNVISITLRQV